MYWYIKYSYWVLRSFTSPFLAAWAASLEVRDQIRSHVTDSETLHTVFMLSPSAPRSA